MPLPEDIRLRLSAFHQRSEFARRGGVITDLDGTAVHEWEGRVVVAEAVETGLKALLGLGRPVVLNTLRFPLNVVRTFGRAWSAIADAPIPLVSLNGAVLGRLTPVGEADTVFEEIAAFPLGETEIRALVEELRALLDAGLDDLLVFHYPRDWLAGEIIWTPHPERAAAIAATYLSASSVISGPVENLAEALLSQGACMVSVLADIPQDRRMAYQHANPNRFHTARGVDKLSGAREAARRLDFDLEHSVGAGDTPMDSFLQGVGLALQVGPLETPYQGRMDTIRLSDPAELGAALFALGELQAGAAAR